MVETMLTDRQINLLTSDLVDRLRDQLPAGFTVRIDHGNVVIQGTGWHIIHFEEMARQAGDVPMHVERAVDRVLSGLQDFVVGELGEPWPSAGDEFSPPKELPMPEVMIDWPRIRFWFGSAQDPVLRFDAIEVSAPDAAAP